MSSHKIKKYKNDGNFYKILSKFSVYFRLLLIFSKKWGILKYIIIFKGYPLVFIIHIIIRFFCYDYFNMPKNWIISYLKKLFICSIKIALIYFVYDQQVLLYIKIASNFENMISSSLISKSSFKKSKKWTFLEWF